MGSQPGSAVINSDPGAVRVNGLAQGHIDNVGEAILNIYTKVTLKKKIVYLTKVL